MDNTAVLRSDRLGVWLATCVGSVVLGITLATLRWIPEWQTYINGVVVCSLVASAVASIASFRAARRRYGPRISPKWRVLAYLFVGGLVLALWSFSALIAALAVSGGPFGATYSKQFHFAELGATVYLYDSTFLDPETTVYLRRGWLPLREQVMHLGKSPEEVEVVLRGSELMVDDRPLELR